MAATLNELTFVGHLGTVTGVRAERLQAEGRTPLIVHGEVEERQVDPDSGRVLRCDIRLNAASGRKLASGEMKRPEVAEGRDVLNDSLVADARRKALARGLPYYFTCNMKEIALFEVAARPGQADDLQQRYKLADISRSSDAEAVWPQIDQAWMDFLDDLEDRLRAVETRRPSVTTADVVALQQAIDAIADEAIDRTVNQVLNDPILVDNIRSEAAAAFGFSVALNSRFPVDLRRELLQVLRLGAFVIAQKLVLYRVLSEVGPRRQKPFSLDPLAPIGHSTDPDDVANILRRASQHAIRRSKDYETAFNPRPLDDAVFVSPRTQEQVDACRIGEVWQALIDTISSVSWASISHNLVGFLYEAIVDPEFRHLLGQHYTREDVVDLLVTYAIREPDDEVLDPATGGGSFLRAAYQRKVALGDSHNQALAGIWGCEIAAFAAELSTITLATANTKEPAAYPRVILRDFFNTRPRLRTELQIPGEPGQLTFPSAFDAVIGNPPYISYRHQTNQKAVAAALAAHPKNVQLPHFSGKSDEYLWFIVHATGFLRDGGRLAFIVSSAILFADYGVPLIRFITRHYKIDAVIDSAVERWFIDADTNTVLLMLERCENSADRCDHDIRFIRLRKPLARLLPSPDEPVLRRQAVEDLVDELLTSAVGAADPRMMVTMVRQGEEGGMTFTDDGDDDNAMELEEDD